MSSYSSDQVFFITTSALPLNGGVHVGEKTGALIAMAGITAVFAFLPLYIKRYLRSHRKRYGQNILSGCLCFGAGVLLATVFLHLLPEAEEHFEKHFKFDFPFGKLIFCTGFLLIYLIEGIAHGCSNVRNTHDVDHEMSTLMLSDSFNDIINIESHSYIGDASPNLSRTFKKRNTIKLRNLRTTDSEYSGDINIYNKPSTNSIIMIFALMFHGIMEGFAMVLENKTFNLWILVCALTSHKIFIAFSLGMQLVQQQVNLLHYIIVMTSFSLASPIGGVLGAMVEGLSENGSFPAVLQGVAGGIILYVVFFDILFKERMKDENDPSYIRAFSMILGFTAISILEYIKQT